MSTLPSQADRMLNLLADYQWHDISELWEIGVGRPNSRAAELRPRLKAEGLMVEHRHKRGVRLPSRAHQYRLVPLDERSGGLDSPRGASDSFPPQTGTTPPLLSSSGFGPGGGEEAAQQPDGQLVLVGEQFRRGAR